MLFKKALLSAAVLPWLTSVSFAHSDIHAHGVAVAQIPHVHFGSGHILALGSIGLFVAIMIAGLMLFRTNGKQIIRRK